MLSPKVLIEDTTFTSPTGEGTAILRGQSSLRNRRLEVVGERENGRFSRARFFIRCIKGHCIVLVPVRGGGRGGGRLPWQIS